jgi:hypothetical protein
VTINTVDISASSITIQENIQTLGVGVIGTGATAAAGGAVQQPGAVAGDTAQISGPGQLLAQLQQLQGQDPTKFKELALTIATQLLNAVQQDTTNQASFLTTLANNFQTAANTGSVNALLPHHHTHHASGTYNQLGQVTAANAAGMPTATTSTGSANIDQLFASIAQQVAQAVGASAT